MASFHMNNSQCWELPDSAITARCMLHRNLVETAKATCLS